MIYTVRYQEPATGQVMECDADLRESVNLVFETCQMFGYKVLSVITN